VKEKFAHESLVHGNMDETKASPQNIFHYIII